MRRKRWHGSTNPYVPDAIGMAQAFDDRVAGRIAEDARAAGIAAGKAGCHPNITVVFIENGQALVREMRRSHAELFGDMEPHAIGRLVDDPGPIHTWTITETTSRDGDKLRVGTSTGVRAPELQVRSASIIQLTTKRNIVATIIIVDIPAAIGKGLDQIADYAAMRTLAETRGAGRRRRCAGYDPPAVPPGRTTCTGRPDQFRPPVSRGAVQGGRDDRPFQQGERDCRPREQGSGRRHGRREIASPPGIDRAATDGLLLGGTADRGVELVRRHADDQAGGPGREAGDRQLGLAALGPWSA